MITIDLDYEADDVPSELLDGLEQIALALDARQCPAPAWSLVPDPRPRPRDRQVSRALTIGKVLLATGLAAACIIVAAIVARHAPEPPVASTPTDVAAGAPAATVKDAEIQVPGHPAAPNAGVAVDTPPRNDPASPNDDVAKSDGPQIVVVEDLDSYSVIDMSGGSPVVSYVSKDSPGTEYPVPVPFGSGPSPDESDGML